jgi:hypothetical protein
MRIIYRALIATSLLLSSVQALADITLVRADSVAAGESDGADQHRYEEAIKKMDNNSDQITNQLMSRHNGNATGTNVGDNLKVTLIKIHR